MEVQNAYRKVKDKKQIPLWQKFFIAAFLLVGLLAAEDDGLFSVLEYYFKLSMYFMPSIIAFNKKKPDRTRILGYNILIGCTGIGWVLVFIWSLQSNRPRSTAGTPIVRPQRCMRRPAKRSRSI